MRAETYAALVGLAAALVDNSEIHQANSAFANINDWYEVAEQAEIHGLSVMLGRLAAAGRITLPRELDLQLKALTIRHQKVLAARRIVLADVIDILEQHDIDFAFLKGAALSQLIYEPPWLRPMRDVDMLVRRNQASQTQQLLREVGFDNENEQNGFLFDHHHLPNSIRIQDGFTISLEVHHDALSGDVDASIRLDRLNSELQAYQFAERTAYALGHEDMLKHLCFHTFEPAELIKLGSLVDFVRYAHSCVDKINWKELEDSQANVVNALRCIHALIPLPIALREQLGVTDQVWRPDGMGKGFQPLSHIARLAGKKTRLKALFVPSEWWTHVFYVVPPGRSLLMTRIIRHPAMLIKWLLRRYRAAYRSETS